MMLASFVLVALALALAFSNGANDVSKGIATLVGTGVSDEKTAVVWGASWTVAGGLLAAWAAQGLVATFSGKGFLASPIPGTAFLASVAAGAIGWVVLASRTGLPVSTTHAIAGALAGAGIVAQGARSLHWAFLAKKVALPLALSPVLAVVLLTLILPLLERPLSRAAGYCVCLERRVVGISTGSVAFTSVSESPTVATQERCDTPTVAARVSVLDGLHWFSSAMTSLARGLNDTPKVLALAIAASAVVGLRSGAFYALVALAMGAGSLVWGLRVTRTLASGVTAMTPAEGFSANFVTTVLVGFASLAALPVSTTHVSSGAIIGIGMRRFGPGIRWGKVGEIAFAWLITVPVAALLAAGSYALLR
jgi:inorganic phosphate transporter, PiT family